MTAKTRASTTTPSDADVAGYGAVLDLARRFGPDRAAASALYASTSTPVWPLVLLLAARGADLVEVVRVLHLEPGQLAKVVGVAIPAPAAPLPPGEETVFPPDDDDDGDLRAAGPYETRSRQVLLRDAPEPVAASLAVCVPGVRGVVLFMAATGDDRHDAAALLGITVGEVDATLTESDGRHLTRTDG